MYNKICKKEVGESCFFDNIPFQRLVQKSVVWNSPYSTISVNSEEGHHTGIIFTAIHVAAAVTVGARRQPKTHHT
jgi:hypothetical protein